MYIRLCDVSGAKIRQLTGTQTKYESRASDLSVNDQDVLAVPRYDDKEVYFYKLQQTQ